MLLDQTAALRQCIHQYRDTLPALAPHSDAIQYVLEHDNLQALIAIYDDVYPGYGRSGCCRRAYGSVKIRVDIVVPVSCSWIGNRTVNSQVKAAITGR